MPSTNLRLCPSFLLIPPNPPIHQFHCFQLLTTSVICPPAFPNRGVSSVCCSHLYCFSFFLLVFCMVVSKGLVFPAASLAIPEQRKVLQLIKTMVHRKEQALGPIFWVENIGWEKKEVDRIGKLKEEIQSQSRDRKEWMSREMCRAMRKKNVWGTENETLAKNRWFYCMNWKGINYPV